jgi:hypothetical protein
MMCTVITYPYIAMYFCIVRVKLKVLSEFRISYSLKLLSVFWFFRYQNQPSAANKAGKKRKRDALKEKTVADLEQEQDKSEEDDEEDEDENDEEKLDEILKAAKKAKGKSKAKGKAKSKAKARKVG